MLTLTSGHDRAQGCGTELAQFHGFHILPSPLRIAILLGTFQGERFLAQQLDSIHTQTHAGWRLWASDDHSSDATADVLRDYQARWGSDRLHVELGPGRGFSANFLALACNPAIEADYFAFCDQDDLWDADKLATAVAWLERVPRDVPALYCSRTRLIDATNREIRISPLFRKPPIFENALVHSIAAGNTMVFNRPARALLVEAGADIVVQSHDWWTYLLVTGCGGNVYYDPAPHVGYRQHARNLVGLDASWPGRLQRLRRMLAGQFKATNDCHLEALRRMRHRLSLRSRGVLDDFSRAREDWLIPRLLGVSRAGVYGQTAYSNLTLIAAAILKKL